MNTSQLGGATTNKSCLKTNCKSILLLLATCGRGGGRWGTAATWDPLWWETDWNDSETRMINVEKEHFWAYPDSIDNSDRSPSKGRNSLHNVDRATTRGPRNSYIRALQIAWWCWWRYSSTLKTVLWGQITMIILWSRVDPPWRKAINLSSLVLDAICCASNWI